VSIDRLDEARRLLDVGEPRSALELAESALEASRVSGSSETHRRAAHLVAEALFVMGDIAGARVPAGEALRLSQASGDADALGADLNLLGVIEVVEARFDEAVFLLRRSYDLRAEAGGPDSPGAIESLKNLAFAMWRTDEQDNALELHEEALRRCEYSLGEDHARTAETLAALAVTLETRPESRKRARALHERALASGEVAQGPDSALVARLLANVAVARMNDGDLESAGPALERALELHERHFGLESRWTTYAVQTQGEYAYEQGRYEDARSAFERALVLRVRDLGPERRETLDAATALANTLKQIAGRRRSEEPGAAPAAGDPMEDATALERVVLALDPDLAGAAPAVGGIDPTEAAEQLRRIAARIESRRTANEVVA
jgi:tetratricopeptide (TPR) repeat protein